MQHVSTDLVTHVLAPALAVALSPVPLVIALVLLIHNVSPRTSGLAYLLGRAAVLTLLALGITSVPWLSAVVGAPLPHWADGALVAVGVVLVVLGILAWRRGAPTAATESRWHRQVGGIRPAASLALGLLPPLANPKVVASSVVADSYISGLTSAAGRGVAIAGFVMLACSTVAVPVLTYCALGPRIDPKLKDLRRWIERRQRALNAVALVVMGVIVVLYALT